MSDLAAVRESDRIGNTDMSDQHIVTPPSVAGALLKPAVGNAITGGLMMATFAISCVGVTAAWGALLVWGASWLIWR
jgi:hypothetical protein